MQHGNKPPLKGRLASRAPPPSPALLALQAEGFELPSRSFKPFSSSPPRSQSYNASLISVETSSSEQDKRLSSSFRARHNRTSSTYSGEISITDIVRLYAEQSMQVADPADVNSIISTSPESGFSEEIQKPLLYHQPKAYRDTVAHILDHQHRNSYLYISPITSSSLPHESHATFIEHDSHALFPRNPFSISEPELTLRKAGHWEYSLSAPSILPFTALCSLHKHNDLNLEEGSNTTEQLVTNEVSSVTDKWQHSWFDEPISPISTKEDYVATTLSLMSDKSAIDQHQEGSDTLSPLLSYSTPINDPDSTVQDELLVGPTVTIATCVADSKVSHRYSSSDIGSSPSRSTDSFVIQNTLTGHVKAIWRDRKKRKTQQRYSKQHQRRQKDGKRRRATDFLRQSSHSPHTHLQNLNFTSVDYSQLQPGKQPYYGLQKSGSDNALSSALKRLSLTSTYSGPGSVLSISASSLPQPTEDEHRLNRKDHSGCHDRGTSGLLPSAPSGFPVGAHAAVPLSKYQKYGIEYWYASNKNRRKRERATLRRAVLLDKTRQQSKGAHAEKTMKNTPSPYARTCKRNRGLDNNARNTTRSFIKNLTQSSDERRRAKLKKSISLVSGTKLDSKRSYQ